VASNVKITQEFILMVAAYKDHFELMTQKQELKDDNNRRILCIVEVP